MRAPWRERSTRRAGAGVDTGTAGTFTQAVMAILVYGASALIVGAGLIGALRNQ